MKAILARTYGTPDVLTLEEVDQPTPGDDQVLVEVHAAATNPSYWHRMEGRIPMLRQAYGDPAQAATSCPSSTDCRRRNSCSARSASRFSLASRVCLSVGGSGLGLKDSLPSVDTATSSTKSGSTQITPMSSAMRQANATSNIARVPEPAPGCRFACTSQL